MQDVTDAAFMKVVAEFGAPDYFVTEYFRVHGHYQIEKHILKSITENETGRPVFAQLIGQDIDALVRVAKQLEQYPVAGIDLNLGCPAPVVCRKDAGGGLLRIPERMDEILAALREAVSGRFTVKTRVGFHSIDEFERLLEVFSKHAIDALTIHGRTVKERYQTPVHHDCVRRAVESLPCPVIANGNMVDVSTARAYHAHTGAAGLMIGRGAIRHPWIFQQIRDSYEGKEPKQITRLDLLEYVEVLFETTAAAWKVFDPSKHVNKMKKYMVYISQGLDAEFEYQIRRAKTPEQFFEICRAFMDDKTPLPDFPPEHSKLFCGFRDLL